MESKLALIKQAINYIPLIHQSIMNPTLYSKLILEYLEPEIIQTIQELNNFIPDGHLSYDPDPGVDIE